jgi:hypothetical protein
MREKCLNRSIVRTAFFLSFATAISATTPQQAATRWASFAPGMSGKIVYGDNAPQGNIRILDLAAGTTKQIAKYDVESNVFGSSCFRWSPNGRRILTQNFDSVNVLNEDGSNMKLIAKAKPCCDMIWGDWDNDSAIVYSTGKTVVRAAIHSDNTAGTTEVLVSTPPAGQGYTCVGIYGNWLSYIDYAANFSTKGGHRPLLKNLKTGVVTKLIADNDDMCQLTMIPDSHYKTLGEMWSHLVPGTICDTNGNHIEELPRISTYPQREFSWSNQLEYFMSQGENSSNQWAWIRSWSKRATSASIIVSDTGSMVMYYPDLWVTPIVGTHRGTGMIGSGHREHRMPVTSVAALAAKSGAVFFSAKGSVIDPQRAGSFPAGIYIVKIPGAAPERCLVHGR